jgi:hypothetical protein
MGYQKSADFNAYFEYVEKVSKRLLRKTFFASNFSIYETHMEFALFANLKAERGKNGSKKPKTYFRNVCSIPTDM